MVTMCVTMVTVCGYHGYSVWLPSLDKLPASVSVSLALVTFTVVGSGELLHLTLVDPLYQLQVPPVPGGVSTTKYTGPILMVLSENFQHGRFDCIATSDQIKAINFEFQKDQFSRDL